MLKWAFAVVTVVLVSGALRAGLYNPAEREEGKLNPDFAEFQKNTLFSLRIIRVDKVLGDPLQMRYIMMQQSAPRVIPPEWNLPQRLSLSAYLIRREKFQEAIELLKPLSRKESDNFLVYSNLSTAYHLSGQEATLAYDALDQALTIWPDNWNKLDDKMQLFLGQIGWDETKFRRYREAEIYQRELLKLRRLEKPKSQPETLDNLFGVNFVGESGSYEAGKLAAKEKAKLPARALTIVQQLLVWSPHDPRLYWLLGEIYNAQGDVATALKIFKSPELTGEDAAVFPAVPGFRVPLLVDHVRTLKKVPVPETNTQVPETKPPPEVTSNNPSFDVRTLLIGVFAGIIISIFAYWQIREIMRRR